MIKDLKKNCPPRNLPSHLVSDLDPDDCIHHARCCAQCDNDEYYNYWNEGLERLKKELELVEKIKNRL